MGDGGVLLRRGGGGVVIEAVCIVSGCRHVRWLWNRRCPVCLQVYQLRQPFVHMLRPDTPTC